MRKIIWFLLAWLLAASTAFAAGAVKTEAASNDAKSSVLYGTADAGDSVVRVKTAADGTVYVHLTETTGDLTFQTNLLANGRYGASSVYNSSSSNLMPSSVPYSVVRKNVGATAETMSLPNGTKGQTIVFVVTGLVTGGTFTLTPVTSYGWSSITFTAKGNLCQLLYLDDVNGWIPLNVSGATLNQVGY